jgi:hypothetical protein
VLLEQGWYNEAGRAIVFLLLPVSDALEGYMARTCVWCGDPLPEPEYRGHRRREFCKPPKTCKQQHYLWHKQMRRDADALADPYWRAAYAVLVEHYKLLEKLLQDRVADLEEAQRQIESLEESRQYHIRRYEDLQIDYVARLRALGMSEQDIEEFNTYWGSQR